MKSIKYVLLLSTIIFSLSTCKEDKAGPECKLPEPTSDYIFEISENSAKGAVVGDAALVDVDHAEHAVNYIITNGNEANAFEIDAGSGIIAILTRTAVDYEVHESFSLEITASAEGCTSVLYNVQVNVENQIDKPFVDSFYKTVIRDQLVVYGEANEEDQVMDVYYPLKATGPFPLLVIAGGGQWNGSDLTNFIAIGNRMASAGYVVAAIRYVKDSQDVMDPQVRAITGNQDLRTAIRYFRKDAANDDIYKVDTDNIFLGGFGTGAFLALQSYVTENDVNQAELDIINANGGFEGEHRGNAGYSSDFKALVSMAGAVYDLNWIDANEYPIICVHAINDPDVAFGEGTNRFGATTYGPDLIFERTTELDIYSQLVAIDSQNHDAPVECDACYVEILKFLEPLIE